VTAFDEIPVRKRTLAGQNPRRRRPTPALRGNPKGTGRAKEIVCRVRAEIHDALTCMFQVWRANEHKCSPVRPEDIRGEILEGYAVDRIPAMFNMPLGKFAHLRRQGKTPFEIMAIGDAMVREQIAAENQAVL
jgi:hypothetical protein